MNWLSRWWKGTDVKPLGFEEKLKLMLQSGLAPCLSIKRSQHSQPEYWMVTGIVNDELGIVGIGHLSQLSVGSGSLRLCEIDTFDFVNAGDVFGNNGVDRGLQASIEELAHLLPYDKRVKVFTSYDGVDYYVKGGFNTNHYGFTIEVPCNEPWCERGYIAGFVHYSLAQYYQGEWATAYLSEDLPGFVYHDWMGDKVSPVRLAEKHERIKQDVHKRWAAYQVQRKALDTELNEILNMLKKYDLHIEH
jgi:hypothetical protein